MFAVVANGIQTICKTQRKLDAILAIYAYPKFCKCATEEEAREWLRRHSRVNYKNRFIRYGTTSDTGYIQVEYFIDKETIYYNINTKHIGFVRIDAGNNSNVLIDNRSDFAKVKISHINVDDDSIVSHVIALRRILMLLGDIVDVDFIVPDISIYLAATKYTGKNYMIRGLQHDIQSRVGGVSFTVKEIKYEEECADTV